MEKITLTFFTVIIVIALVGSSSAATARCTCSGRCGTFTCSNPRNTRGCDCVRCRCIPGSVGFRTCCARNCGWLNRRKCYRCQIWESCNCRGCR